MLFFFAVEHLNGIQFFDVFGMGSLPCCNRNECLIVAMQWNSMEFDDMDHMFDCCNAMEFNAMEFNDMDHVFGMGSLVL